ncbi:MAG: undecaprenyl/decaprenyl-phosphate alpha-N-acetylglucosaminyl 1-phosphate transferase [Candidatus Marinimicrobia bacterium]|nr:undecaprenyl/decaprenyl-phosphate alpha-N-acetylglucosaminyl 1-phosphate transferase [Candidatus Neomarinimicrobiota bacterium]HOG75461.1 MraY family glycosyltransferase [Candidatus Neomarinimicrobiota bacterium]HQM36337.1 MraY family glycosyltransferase [Candidatus Neomarinimicrobiota bacterium]
MNNHNKKILFRMLVLPFLMALLLPYVAKTWMFSHNLSKIYYLLVTSLMTFGLIPIFYKLGVIMDITDKPGGRHIHQHATPRTGGIAIFITFIITLNIVTKPPREFTGLFFASSVIAFVGIIDDIKHVPALIKLGAQILATIILIKYGIYLSFLPNHIIGNIFSYVLTFIWIIGITNAYNCLDGLDGLAAGTAIIILLFYIIIATYMVADEFMAIVGLILLGAIIGFMPYNFRITKNALIFLGDAGSTFIGFTLAALSIYGNWGISKSVDLVIPILLLGVPIADMIMTTITRIKDGKVKSVRQWLEYGGNDHFHHRLLQMGFTKTGSVLIIWAITTVLGLLSLLLKQGDRPEAIIAILIALILFALIISLMLFEYRQERRSLSNKKIFLK